ncbi:chloride channel protein [Haladaptatus sp. T7]|uniref:chloride channel protein n=1 Tax=Haladaptatus sp. T7 TaxID=2029368 RepID=UPI0021A2547F|nr:chloride channel protein [Haladaptatus sp. T7]GKZ13099.1 chloride channel protein [Haladaptatus sp. T7]
MNLIAIVIGIIAGLGAVVFRLTIWGAQEVFFGTTLNPGNVEFELIDFPNVFGALSFLGNARFLLLPAIGGLLVGVIVVLTTPEVKGHGVPKVMESMLVRGGKIDPKISVYKTVASSLAIGSGGSLGREGPIIQIGSAAGSFFGRFMDQKYTRTLVAAGAAAGIAGTFNAPLAGVMFSLEILLAEYYLQNVIVVVLASVMSTAVARTILEFTPNPGVRAFLVPVDYQMVTPIVEFPLYIGLGFVIGLSGAAVVKMLYGTEHVFERLDLPEYVKPAIGGLLLGATVLISTVLLHESALTTADWLFGVGYATIHSAIAGDLTLKIILALAILKLLAFSFSVGSGSSGGVFSPGLYIGAMIGGGFGILASMLFPGTAGPGAYALVGMGGVFAATARAPLTATLIIFELTGQYTIILPLLVVTVIGSVVTQRLLNRGTIYTEKLRDKGITVQERRIGSLEDLTAKDVMTTNVDTLTTGSSCEDALMMFQQTKHHGLPIVDESGSLVGIMTLTDLESELTNSIIHTIEGREEINLPDEELAPVEKIGTTEVLTVPPSANLLSVVDIMEKLDVGRIPIVDEENHPVGIVTRSDILDAYDNIPELSRGTEVDIPVVAESKLPNVSADKQD